MLALLLACAPLAASTGEPSAATVEEVELDTLDDGYWALDLSRPRMVVVACESSTGRVEYGPSATLDVGWYDGELLVRGAAGEYERCLAWVAR